MNILKKFKLGLSKSSQNLSTGWQWLSSSCVWTAGAPNIRRGGIGSVGGESIAERGVLEAVGDSS